MANQIIGPIFHWFLLVSSLLLASLILFFDFRNGYPCLVEIKDQRLTEVAKPDFWKGIVSADGQTFDDAEIGKWPKFFDHYSAPEETASDLDEENLDLFKLAYGRALFELVSPKRSGIIYVYNLGLFAHFFFWSTILFLCCSVIFKHQEGLMLSHQLDNFLSYLLKALGASALWFPFHSRWFESKNQLYADDPTQVFFYLPIIAWICAALVIMISMSDHQRKSIDTWVSILTTGGSIAVALVIHGNFVSNLFSRDWTLPSYILLALPIWVVSAFLVANEFLGGRSRKVIPNDEGASQTKPIVATNSDLSQNADSDDEGKSAKDVDANKGRGAQSSNVDEKS